MQDQTIDQVIEYFENLKHIHGGDQQVRFGVEIPDYWHTVDARVLGRIEDHEFISYSPRRECETVTREPDYNDPDDMDRMDNGEIVEALIVHI